MNGPFRPPLRYHGSKWRLAPFICGLFPEHRAYVEPFGGSASVLLRKPRSDVEIYNDLDDEVVNVFSVLRSPRAGELLRLLELTPFAEAEYLAAYDQADCPVERARRVIVRSFQGFGTDSIFRRNGFRKDWSRRRGPAAPEWARFPEALEAVVERLRGVTILRRDAFSLLEELDAEDVVFYVDPPYAPETRLAPRHGYRHELDSADHSRLLDALRGMEASVVLSGYASELYDRALTDWHRFERRARNAMHGEALEVVWCNFRPAAAEQTRLAL